MRRRDLRDVPGKLLVITALSRSNGPIASMIARLMKGTYGRGTATVTMNIQRKWFADILAQPLRVNAPVDAPERSSCSKHPTWRSDDRRWNPLPWFLGRLGGIEGGTSFTARQRSEIARKAAQARWRRREPRKILLGHLKARQVPRTPHA